MDPLSQVWVWFPKETKHAVDHAIRVGHYAFIL